MNLYTELNGGSGKIMWLRLKPRCLISQAKAESIFSVS